MTVSVYRSARLEPSTARRAAAAASATNANALAVAEAREHHAIRRNFAIAVSAYFVLVVLGVAAVALIAWFAIGPIPAGSAVAVERFVAVLVIASPYALGLAAWAAVAAGTDRGAELGILVKGGAALQAASRIDTVLVAKTGIVTEGRPQLTDIVDISGRGELELLALVAAVERRSEHPVAQAIVRGAESRGAHDLGVADFIAQPGGGVEGRVAGARVRIGTTAWLAAAGIATDALDAAADALAVRGRTPSFVAIDGVLAGLVAVVDRPTEAACRAVAALDAMGIEVALVTGDRKRTARAVANELGIQRVFAEARLEDKARIVAAERARGRTVAIVGDNIDDALAGADVRVAIGTGTDIAAAADIVLLRGGIASLPRALDLARRTLRTIRRTLFWAFIFGAIGIPLAAGALYGA